METVGLVLDHLSSAAENTTVWWDMFAINQVRALLESIAMQPDVALE